jgi:hypothetical protein
MAARRRAVLRRRFGFFTALGIEVVYVQGPPLSNGRDVRAAGDFGRRL